MHCLLGSIAILSLFSYVKSQDPTPLPVRARADVTSGEARLFSGEDVTLGCSVPDHPETEWKFLWFRNGVPLSVQTQNLSLKNIPVQKGGNYSCRGEKDIDIWPYSLMTMTSEPLAVHVDGGWTLLQIPTEPLLIEEKMTLTCRIRGDPLLVEVIFYKDSVEVQKRKDKDLVIPRLVLKDEGLYRCRATWVQSTEHHSAQSLSAYLPVLDKLNTPVLELDFDYCSLKGDKVVLSCKTQLNVREEGLSIEYFFLKNGKRQGPGSSSATFTIFNVEDDDGGEYTCKARVRALNLERHSESVKLEVCNFPED
ncbi:high affinity immunoglobulin gamma Fc receptor I-like [Hoplias malabaricus]|uniref:high affinity immunoglobulin gamma Fc receptor I-like n=1 Tax=Hoplias malabaricus TaxID=27720 RepID=UPI0034623B63